jgi:hypothetical protein
VRTPSKHMNYAPDKLRLSVSAGVKTSLNEK